ncbi:insulin-like growth factor-binding complex acid labile subunit [Brachionus plicatilis]|uniref:Insulin-like growth factor-binding complex acid labile subunit n=1 Tax=Brachionus plicatilis TaxID=10195 RepID=A0A3M7Q8C6_BRAPC|nr:insulin-like growth factor-binding complex acid labile subunit [Brachionus plicatilis]
MISIKKKIIDYYDEIENSVNVQCEKCIQHLQAESDVSGQLANINQIRELFINKIKEICTINLNNLTDSADDFCHEKFCFFLSNHKMKAGPEQNIENLIFGPAYHFYFENRVGKLVIVSKYLDEIITIELNEIINEQRKNFRKEEKNLLNFERLLKVSVLLDLLEKKFKDQTPLIDLSNVSENQMKQLMVNSDQMPELKATDFDCLDSLIDTTSIQEFHFSHAHINFVPNRIFKCMKNLASLDLNCQMIERLEQNNFVYLENLVELSIINCSLSWIEKNSFNGLKNLKSLILTMNYLDEIHSDMLLGLENLENFNISQNTIRQISENTFVHLVKLTSLMLNDNRINKLDKSAFNGLGQLKILDLNFSNNELVIDSTALDSLTALEVVDLGNNKIKMIEENTFKNSKNIKFLNLRHNSISDLNFLKNFEKIEFLDIKDVDKNIKIDGILECLGEIKSLKFLIFEAHQIPKLGSNFKNLQGLEISGVSCIADNSFLLLDNLDYLKLVIQNDSVMDKIDFNQFNGLNCMKYFAIETQSIGPNATEKFRSKESIFLSLFVPNDQVDHKVFYLNFDDMNILVVEIKNCDSEKIYFENMLEISEEVRNSMLRSFYINWNLNEFY